ncbi:MAG: 50S ribosomal protein L1 [Candidatus Dadabacteria bacterium]|nr:MAG: 50S ribosomal protein L1 [Candidatus Dadabacteria bacterium]
MAKKGKRYRAALARVEKGKYYSLEDACKLASEISNCKFDETVDVAVRLGVDPRKADQNVRGSTALPHGLGKKVRVAVFAKGEKVNEAQEAGADIVGGEDLVEKVKEGFLDFDSVIATPDMMGQVGKIGKILGPRGLMPSPKVGTVTFDVAETVKAIKAGRADFRVDKAGNVHAPIGKASFGGEKLSENCMALIQALNKAKPSTSKGVYLKSAAISTTMGPGIKVDVTPLRNV